MVSFRTGLLRVALASVVALALIGGFAKPGVGLAYAAVGIEIGFGILLMLGKPRFVLNEKILHVLIDILSVTLLVLDTGGGESPLLSLYFLVALGMAGLPGLTRVGAGIVALMAGYTVAVYGSLTGGAAALGVRGALILLISGIAGVIGAELRSVRRERRDLSSALAEGHGYQEKVTGLVSELGSLLSAMNLEGILQWTAGTARDLTKAHYAHVAVLDGNHHKTAAGDDHDSYPSWWHPEIQRLALWSCREDRVLRSEEAVGGIEGLMAVPVVGADGSPWGAIVVGGIDPDSGEERLLGLLASQTAAALEKASVTPGGRDAASGLPSRSSLQRVLKRELTYGRTMTVVMADLNGFRRYNQAYGLEAGDALLREIGFRLERSQHLAFRYGGDEFVLILKGSGSDRARRAALGFQQMVTEITAGSRTPLTASTGFTITPSGDVDPDVVLDAAAKAVNKAKGRSTSTGEPGYQDFKGVGIAEPVETRAAEAAMVLVEAAEVRAPSLGVHLRSVSRLSGHLGSVLGLSQNEIDSLAVGGLLHDLGKIGIPDSILFKTGSLTGEEYRTMKRHPELGVRILETMDELSSSLPVVKHHHERFDGNGYPDGLRAEDIPFAARIVFVADAFDSMVRDRPYRYRLSSGTALEEISRNSGTQFDPQVVVALEQMIRQEGWQVGLAN